MPKPHLDDWKEIPPEQNSGLFLTPKPGVSLGAGSPLSPEMQERFSNNVVLYFPSDRFEPPDWLNSGSVRSDLAFQDPLRFEGNTSRNIFSRSLLKPTLEWLRGVVLDRYLCEIKPVELPVNTAQGINQVITVQVFSEGPNGKLINTVAGILGEILNTTPQSIGFGLGNRNAPSIGITIGGKPSIPDLLSLSAGQSALFCMFCAILRDADLAKQGDIQIEEIKGIVVIDEADLHLHLDLQHRALPRLMKLFPKVQFVLTAHSPILVSGLEKEFGASGIQLLEMPNGLPISSECYSEFEAAFQHFSETRRFKTKLIEEIEAAKKPVLIVEGDSDRVIFEEAWRKLELSREMPFEVHSCGESRLSKAGGAKTLYALIEAIALYETRPILGLFDNDREGAEQFNSLNEKKSFAQATQFHRKHEKGYVAVMVLPPPPGRELFAPDSISHRLLEIEHYFSDEILGRFQAAGDNLYGSPVFEIRDSAKSRIAAGVTDLEPSDFENFRALFSAIENALQIST